MEHALPRRTASALRTWSLCMTSENHGTVGPAGCTFSHAPEKHERVLVVEVPAAAGAPVDQVNLQLVGARRPVAEFKGYVDGEPAVTWLDRDNMPRVGAKLFTQAAANKAAEEGELSRILWTAITRLERKESTEQERWAAVDALRTFCATAADRASRQVANNADVEPVSIHCREFHELAMTYRAAPPFRCASDAYEALTAHIDQHVASQVSVALATPPATTGASTVLTDERIAELFDEYRMGYNDYANQPQRYCERFARAIAREVAAQAGQVAVPAIPKGIWYCAEHDNFYENGKGMGQGFYERWSNRAKEFPAAPSPAKESK